MWLFVKWKDKRHFNRIADSCLSNKKKNFHPHKSTGKLNYTVIMVVSVSGHKTKTKKKIKTTVKENKHQSNSKLYFATALQNTVYITM